MPKYLINKVFIELRYHDSLLFNDMKYLQEIINELSGLFNNQNFDSNNKALFLSNDDTNLKVTVFNNRLIIDQDEATSLEKFKDSSIDILRIIISKLCINSFIRVGMRTLRGIETKNINEANTFIRKNFIKVNERDLGVLGNTFNTRVGFNTRFKDYDISLMLSPNLFQIISIRDGKVVKNIDTPQILVDTDVFKDGNIDANKLIEDFIDDVIDCNYNIIDKFVGKVSVY